MIRFAPSHVYKGKLIATVATLGFGLESDIVASENNGRRLINDFVVLGINHASMNENDGLFNTVLDVPKTDTKTTRQAVVVWISASGSQKPLQATGGWLADSP